MEASQKGLLNALLRRQKINEQIKDYISKYSSEVIDLFEDIRDIIYGISEISVNEVMWAKIPSYYMGERFVRLIPFKDHINVEARRISEHKDELMGYKITPKGMLQIFIGEDIPKDALGIIFKQTLAE